MSVTSGGVDAFRVVIPARRASQRLADKPLRKLVGKPLILHVHDNALRSGAERVVVATDDEEIAACVRDAGGEARMTSSSCASGSDRIAEAIDSMRWPDEVVVVNVQGDEPFLEAEDVRTVAGALARFPDAAVSTLSAPLEPRYRDDPNVVKVVTDERGAALDFSRSMIEREEGVCRRHLGVYAYRCGYLRRFTRLPSPEIERRERLEQLRALFHGDLIQVSEARSEIVLGIDTEEDLHEAERLLGERLAAAW